MASDKPEKKEKKKDKKEKKVKTSDDGITKVKSEKKDKKKKKDAIAQQLEANSGAAVSSDNDAMDIDDTKEAIPLGALVPFANPLADEKQTKKLLKVVKKCKADFQILYEHLPDHNPAASNKTLKRGVKEVVKGLRTSTSTHPASSNISDPSAVVVIAADISPMDVISHLPVLCEDQNIPYIYVASRAELGAAGNTKRSTSVVMIQKNKLVRPGKEEAGVDDEYKQSYAELVKLVRKASNSVKI